MIFRNSMRSIFRTMGKTALFILLIFALTLVLSLGVGVWTSVAQFLDECEDFFTTIALVEYMGTEYPGDTVSDLTMDQALQTFDTSIFSADESTQLWEESTRTFGYIDGFWRSDNYMPARGSSVMVVGNIFYSESHHQYNAQISEVLYSEYARDNIIVLIDGNFHQFEKGHYYLVFGEVYYLGSPLLKMRIDSYDNTIASSLGIEVPRVIDITSDDPDELYHIPEDTVLWQVADTLKITNNSVMVVETNDLLSSLSFHQEETYLIDGRAFTPEEYANAEKVIVISDLAAVRLEVGIGDTVNLSAAVSDQPGIYNSYWVESGFDYNDTYTVVGITNTLADKNWYVYIPYSPEVPASTFPVGYTIGHAIINNNDAAEFSARLTPSLIDRVKMTIYDQGYAAVAVPFQTILRVSQIVTGVCLLVEFAVIILFGFLYVYRQRETAETMLYLGAGRRRVVGYFLFSAGVIGLVASISGAVAGYALHDSIIQLIVQAAENYSLFDPRYSNGNLSISRTLEFAPHLELQLFLIVGVVVFFMTMLACLGFVVGTFSSMRMGQRSQKGPKKAGRTSILRGGSFKYAFLSIIRGGTRTLVVPALAAVVVLFFGQLATTSLRYQEQLESIYDETTIPGNFTAIKGKQISGLVLNAYDIFNLYHTGYIDSLTISNSEPYYYLGKAVLANGIETGIEPLYVPRGSFARESMEAQILRGPDLTAINDIYTSPEFLYSSTILMDFVDGFDETFLSLPAGDERVYSCLVPSSLMQEENIEYGDVIRVAINDPYMDRELRQRIYRHYDVEVIGSYEKQGKTNTIYVPLALFFDTGLMWGEERSATGPPNGILAPDTEIDPQQKELLLTSTLNSAHFTVADTRSLDEFKTYLAEYGYSQVNQISRIREFLVMDDANFNNSVSSVKQQIQYVDRLYPVLYVLTGIIALVTSYLLVVSRKMELAVMRGLGTRRLRTFFSFFIEQSLLCILGILVGFVIWVLVSGIPAELHLLLTAGFLVCYFLGSAISIGIMNHSNVLTILTDKD